MAEDLDLFKKFLYEAPGDDPPDVTTTNNDQTDPPPVPDEGADDSGPPEINDSPDDIDTGPPEINDDVGTDDTFGEDPMATDEEQQPELELNEKISAIMNMNLYQRYLELLSNINSEISQMKDNSDMLYAITPSSVEMVANLSKLDENINMYINHYFMNNDYSKNLLFFNKCLNLLALLNKSFDDDVKKGVKSIDS